MLIDIENKVRERWQKSKVYEANVPKDRNKPKFFCTFPYPYVNGPLHLGHSFSLSKAEFAAGYQRMLGKEVLFPFGFHCTGMPIKACADKLKRELEDYGCPPDFNKVIEVEKSADDDDVVSGIPKDPSKGKKSKLLAKTGTEVRQWNILKYSGIPEEDIPKFADAEHWLKFFPPMAKKDLDTFGLHVDWRRSFITTDVNPFYDSFIRWQFSKLYQGNKLAFGKRPTIYSPLDGQPCADHDRAIGEGVVPQEMTGIKMRVLEFHGKLAQLNTKEYKDKVYLVAATLRPETMYGQTNCWVLPEGDYGAFKQANGEVYIMCHRAAVNLSYQEHTSVQGQVDQLLELKGTDLIGVPLKAPNALKYDRIYTLPLLTISMGKGTGIVTSVPSDAPDDYAALQDWKLKKAFREKYNIKDEWVLPYEVIPIIDVPEFGQQAAVKVYNDLKIQSQNDKDKLAQAKEMVYMKGFYEGVLLVGKYAGKTVRECKPLIREEMINAGDAIKYYEPEKHVVSRSGDECVVCFTDQWFIAYGEAEWKAQVLEMESTMEMYTDETKQSMAVALDWLNQWPCSRTYGLGTYLPFDRDGKEIPKKENSKGDYLIDSLSDSTIYMAYYTVAHLLQGGNIDGSTVGPLGIKPQQLNYDTWNYIFLDAAYNPKTMTVPEVDLKKLRDEFTYWYPLDLRVSGKDLIQNHLTFWLYNHAAIFPKKFWPRGVRANGHLLINNEKMSKSTGRFLTMAQAFEKFSTDATRIALCDAGDGMEDANFLEETADRSILRLTTQITWMKEILDPSNKSLRDGEPNSFADKVFENEINLAISGSQDAYDKMLFREALKVGFYDLQAARDFYRDVYRSHGEGEGMNRKLIKRFCEVQTLLLCPITPHIAEYMWTDILGQSGLAVSASFPKVSQPVNLAISAANKYLEASIHSFRLTIQKMISSKKISKDAKLSLEIIVAQEYPQWQQVVLSTLEKAYDAKNNVFKLSDAELAKTLSSRPEIDGPKQKKVMPFLVMIKQRVLSGEGVSAMSQSLPFDEMNIMTENHSYIVRTLDLDSLKISHDTEGKASPGRPLFNIINSK